MLTAEQLRAARALVRWDQAELADAAKVSVQTVKRMEGQAGAIGANMQTVESVMVALRGAGVVFLSPGETLDGGPGVRLAE